MAASERGLAHGQGIVSGMALTRDLANQPANVCTPGYLARAAKKLSEDHIVSIDYSRGEEFIKATRNPTNALAVNGVNPIVPSTSKWYPGGSGGVPAVAVMFC